jgi:hypothetical protein
MVNSDEFIRATDNLTIGEVSYKPMSLYIFLFKFAVPAFSGTVITNA